MKVSDLRGAALDYWVARADAFLPDPERHPVADIALFRMARDSRTWADMQAHPNFRYSPSTDWAQGGPIIERERPELMPCWPDGGWYARSRARPCDGDQQFGETALIAAMRSFVNSKFGEVVPDEVLA